MLARCGLFFQVSGRVGGGGAAPSAESGSSNSYTKADPPNAETGRLVVAGLPEKPRNLLSVSRAPCFSIPSPLSILDSYSSRAFVLWRRSPWACFNTPGEEHVPRRYQIVMEQGMMVVGVDGITRPLIPIHNHLQSSSDSNFLFKDDYKNTTNVSR